MLQMLENKPKKRDFCESLESQNIDEINGRNSLNLTGFRLGFGPWI